MKRDEELHNPDHSTTERKKEKVSLKSPLFFPAVNFNAASCQSQNAVGFIFFSYLSSGVFRINDLLYSYSVRAYF